VVSLSPLAPYVGADPDEAPTLSRAVVPRRGPTSRRVEDDVLEH